jgi:hypothetical protein
MYEQNTNINYDFFNPTPLILWDRILKGKKDNRFISTLLQMVDQSDLHTVLTECKAEKFN